MSYPLCLGAINKQTGKYVYPKIANKKDEYICPECNEELILCQGNIRIHYFRHKVDTMCNHYSNPTESQIHMDAKRLMKNILEQKIEISFTRECSFCKKTEEWDIPSTTETSTIHLEYRFNYNGVKIADVAYIDDGDLLCIFEIKNTHKTCSENRPEPWFEVDAETLIRIVNNNLEFKIPCIRTEKCEDCCLNDKRNKLVQEIKKYNNMLENITGWGATNSEKYQKYKLRKKIENLEEQLELIKNKEQSITKEEKIKKIKQCYEAEKFRFEKWQNSLKDDEPDYDLFKRDKIREQHFNYLNALERQLKLIENDVDYKIEKGLILVLKHPETNKKLKISITGKTFYEGKWGTSVSDDMLIKWYKGNYSVVDSYI